MTKLKKFQIGGVDAIHGFDGRALLADDMGLGKTIQAGYWWKEARECYGKPLSPLIVVCPASLKLHWKRELKVHLEIESLILSTRDAHLSPMNKREEVLIINYDILPDWVGVLSRLKPKAIIGDEIHTIGNLRTKRCKAFRYLCEGVKYIIGISGTPLTNQPFELFPILNILCPKEFPNPFSFGHKYCYASRPFGRWEFKGGRNLKKLNKVLLSTCMIRRTKLQVMSELPEKIRSILPFEISNRLEYARAEKDIIAWLAETDLAAAQRASFDVRTKFTYLKRLAAEGKLKSVMGWIDEYLHSCDGKLLVGTHHRSITNQLHERYLGASVVIHGGKTMKQRQEAEERFRGDSDCRILFGQIKAAGVGLNLPEATDVAFAELPWTPGAMQQFIDRAHRMTSKHSINVWLMIAQETIEQKICEIIQRKQGYLDETLDGIGVQASSLTILKELVSTMKGKK